MVETHLQQLAGEQIRYNKDAWEFTGTVDVKQNGEVLEAEARKPDRVRRNRGTLRFNLQNPPASFNPGNLGEFDVEIERDGNDRLLVVRRSHATNRYRLDSMSYD